MVFNNNGENSNDFSVPQNGTHVISKGTSTYTFVLNTMAKNWHSADFFRVAVILSSPDMQALAFDNKVLGFIDG